VALAEALQALSAEHYGADMPQGIS
jgi:hypothetical protein